MVTDEVHLHNKDDTALTFVITTSEEQVGHMVELQGWLNILDDV
jgi:hypothetical protein